MKKIRKPQVSFTRHDLTEARHKGYHEAIDKICVIPMMVLRDEFGFGEKRLLQYFNSFMDLIDSMDKEYISLEDMINTIEDETGVKINLTALGR